MGKSRATLMTTAGLTLALCGLASLRPARARVLDSPRTPCVFEPARTVDPVMPDKEDEVTLTLALAARCDPNDRPLHLVIVVEATDSMGEQQLDRLSGALRETVLALGMADLPFLRVGVVMISNGGAQVQTFLTDDPEKVVRSLPSKTDARGDSCVECGLREALVVLRRERSGQAAGELREAILLATVGIEQSQCTALRSSADDLKAFGALVTTACVGRSCEQRCLREAASHERFAFRSWEWGFIEQQVIELVHSSGNSFFPIESVDVDDWLSSNLVYTGGGVPSSVVLNHVSWRTAWPAGGISVTYHARTVACGRFRVSRPEPEAVVTFNNTFWAGVAPSTVVFPNPVMDVPCATSTPTRGPTPTATPGASGTPEPTPSATPHTTPTATDPRLVHVAFLPHALNVGCVSAWPALDLMLAVDVSGSMMAPLAPGSGSGEYVNRLAAARAAAGAMVARLSPGRDQVGVVVYGDEEMMQVLAPLADCCGAARMALDRLPRYNGSRIDLAIDAAAAELTGPRARDASAKVLVLLTDGDLNRTPPARLEERAAAARAAGITLHVVVLGSRPDDAGLDLELLARVTGARSRIHLTHHRPISQLLASLAPAPRCRR